MLWHLQIAECPVNRIPFRNYAIKGFHVQAGTRPHFPLLWRIYLHPFMMKLAAAVLMMCLTVLGASPTEKRQQLAQVITSCTKPNHVAMTFVRPICLFTMDVRN